MDDVPGNEPVAPRRQLDGQLAVATAGFEIKADVTSGEVKQWRYDNHFPGEPVFVARPGASAEDDGVLLTVVLDASQNTPYLLLLDAHNLSEIARAQVPQHIPFGFHGTYTRR